MMEVYVADKIRCAMNTMEVELNLQSGQVMGDGLKRKLFVELAQMNEYVNGKIEWELERTIWGRR